MSNNPTRPPFLHTANAPGNWTLQPTLKGHFPPVQQPGGYCWPTSFNVLGVLFLGEVSSAFLPSKTASWTLKFRPLGVGQQYLMTQGSPPHMKIAGLFSREYPGVFPKGTIGENWVPEGSLRVDILQPSCG